MAEETLYTIGELAELAGVTTRTIRYYSAEGVLPRPDARGQYALYSAEHLLRLRVIARLKAAYLPLGEIKARLEQLTIEQIRELLADEPAEPAPSANAADYLAQVLANQQTQSLSYRQTAERGEPYFVPKMQAFAAPPAAEEAAPPPPASPSAPAYGFAAPAAAPAVAAAPAAAPPSQQPGLLRKLIPQRRARANDAPIAEQTDAEERWRRVLLAPGIELHIREPVAATLRERVERLIGLAREVFGGD